MITSLPIPAPRLSDWALIQRYIEQCQDYIDPFLFNDLRGRGLVWAVDRLQGGTSERKAAAYGRLLLAGKVFGDEQIDGIAEHIERVKALQRELAQTGPTEALTLIKLSGELVFHAQAISDYFRGGD